MRHDSFRLCARDDCQLQGYRWVPEREPRALLQIAHDVAEQADSYAELGERLCASGYGAYALDLRGHGAAPLAERSGHFADRDGWHKVIDDQLELNHLIRRHFPQVPIILLGHSLGGSIALAYLLRYSCSVQAAVLSASSFAPLWRCRIARLLALLEAWRQGPLGRSGLLPHLALGGLGLPLPGERTPFDRSTPNAYIAAPHNEFPCTNQLWLDLFGGLEEIASRQALARIDAELPLLVIGRGHAPFGHGHRLQELYRALRAAGLNSVELKLYPEPRHAPFHEHDRDALIDDLLDWLAHLPARQPYCPLEENA